MTTPAAPARLVRCGPTWMLYSHLAVFAFFLYSFSPAVSLLRRDQDTSATVASLHTTGYSVGVVLIGLLGSRLAARLGRTSTIWAGMATLCVGVGLFCIGPSIPVTLTGAVVTGLGGAMIGNTVASGLSDLHGPSGPSAITEANALAMVIGIVAPMGISAVVALGLNWRVAMAATLIWALLLVPAFRRVSVPAGVGTEQRDAPAEAPGGLGRAYWWAWVAMVLCSSLEFGLTIWAADVVRDRTGASAALGTGAVTAILIGMALGRFASASLTLRHSPEAVLYTSLATVMAGFVVFWTTTTLAVAYAGLFVAGLGIAAQFPLSLARMLATEPRRRDLASSRSSLGIGIAVAAGPFAVGALADAVGTYRSMLVVPVLTVLGALGLWASARVTRRTSADGGAQGVDAVEALPREVG